MKEYGKKFNGEDIKNNFWIYTKLSILAVNLAKYYLNYFRLVVCLNVLFEIEKHFIFLL